MKKNIKKTLKEGVKVKKKFASIVLDKESRVKLLKSVSEYIPDGFKIFTHHMTINFGKGLPENLRGDLGKIKNLRVTEIGQSDKALAVKVDGYYSDNNISHVTIAVNIIDGGKPKDSNLINKWVKLDNYINISGVVTEKTFN